MDSQDFASGNQRPRRHGPWRWALFLLIALLFAAWAALDLLPRLAGGLLGRGQDHPGGEPGVDWDAVEVVWDTSTPATESGRDETPIDAAETAVEPLAAEADMAVPEEIQPPVKPGADGGAGDPAGEIGPAADPALAQAGEGDPAGAGRRSPRILYSEWPRREILLALKDGGSLRYRLRVEADGRVSSWELLADDGFDCESCREEAERIIAGLRFAPGTLNGRAVACWVPYTISFDRD